MQHDAIIVGGGFAGLAAATYLARGRRTVRVLDTGKPRNRFAAESHGFLGYDGSDPRRILDRARTQLLAYPTATLVSAEASAAAVIDGGFRVSLANGDEMTARKLILAFGLRDALPDLPGLNERWGRTVLHCPYCHGIEFSDQPLGVLYRMPLSVHQASLIAEWGPTTLYLNGAELSSEETAMLASRGVAIEAAPIASLIGDEADLAEIELADGRRRAIAALYIAPESSFSCPLAAQLGVEVEAGPIGPVIRTDAEKMTSVAGLYAAGDIARMPHSVSWAVADGVTAGVSAHRALVFG
ncbi:NAD(P)/FAD-dependent oxidoreductase [Sphingomonas gei]|uniref:Thioredoxin reductase n=1 Tax=Sphingomonas gei TaxID=1395960 RepID=A0A4S1X3U2_9SPHN|nr:NAD(P)/FAD-dependent oxidoreductase [Sphingomonas gei]TGX49580.1 NAD(P)/FAD-dependent oxidoreductase [Sphingomonas gei]